jgi:hypothetical protein
VNFELVMFCNIVRKKSSINSEVVRRRSDQERICCEKAT